FFEHKLGFNISFPDTSNTHFQSHAKACAVIITYLDQFIEFLTCMQQNKGSGNVSVYYMGKIRGPHAAEDNVLRLGPLHQCIIDHIDTLIDPTLVHNIGQ
ncbi:hypothetical protein EV359DRAFT_52339, partial [Lentinula novae-zelandiae]